MTVLEALAILESAVLECKKRSIDTSEVREALDLLEPYIRPEWLIPQFRHNLLRTQDGHVEVAKEGQQQVLRATFPVSVIQSANFSECERMRWRVNSTRYMT